MTDTPQLLLDNQLCFRLYTASRLIVQAYEPYFKPLGITYTQYLVLMVLWEENHQPVNTIGRRLLLGINTTSPLIKRMEAMGLVERRGSDDDKRVQVVSLTEKGKAMKAEAAQIPSCMQNVLGCKGIDLSHMAAMIPMLDELIDHIANKEE